MAWWAAWVTVTVLVGAPGTDTVTVPVLVDALVLAATFIVKKPPPVLVPGVICVIVSQD